MERRTFLSGSIAVATSLQLGAIGASGISRLASANTEVQYPNDQLEVGTWMDNWIAGKKAVDGSLHVLRFKNPIYVITKDITWVPNPGQEEYEKVTVPKGFVTDFASIPRIFWRIMRPDGNYTYPAIVHDYLYWKQERTRQESDIIFRIAMEDFEISSPTIQTIYGAVRVGGGLAWNNNKKQKEEGELRILKKFPQDPTITWEEWKNTDGVF